MFPADPAVGRAMKAALCGKRLCPEQPQIEIQLSLPDRDPEESVFGASFFQADPALFTACELRRNVAQADRTHRACLANDPAVHQPIPRPSCLKTVNSS